MILSKIIKKIVIAVAIILALIIFLPCIYSVYPSQYVLVKQFGRVERVVSESGVNFKLPFIQSIDRLPKSTILYDMKASDVITKDKKSMIVDNYVLWKITDPLTFYKTLNTISEAEQRIDTNVFNAIKNKIGMMNQTEVVADRNKKICNEIIDNVNTAIAKYGISIESIEIKRLDLPNENKQAVYNRMISERNQIAKGYRAEGEENAQKIINSVDKEVSIIAAEADASAQEIIAQGESEYMRILAEAYSTPERLEFYEFIRSLDAMEKTMTGNKTLVLPIDSPLTKMFLDYNK